MPPALQPTFRALADPTRREILRHLSRQPLTIAQVAAHFPMTRAAVKKHLTVLSDGGLIETVPQGRERINRLRPDGIKPVIDWIATFDMFWDDRLTRLALAIEEESENE